MKFYKVRAFTLLFLTRLFGKILAVEVPPILSAAAIIEKDNKILFLDHSYINGYGLPGGMVKAGEDIEAALRREVKEETGFEVADLSFFTSTSSNFKGIPTVSVTFLVRVTGKEVESHEGKLVWLDPAEASGKMAYPGAEVTLKKYLAQIL
jgi:ADP-ribose pyrophosphatase YjhB (NUDIX family)